MAVVPDLFDMMKRIHCDNMVEKNVALSRAGLLSTALRVWRILLKSIGEGEPYAMLRSGPAIFRCRRKPRIDEVYEPEERLRSALASRHRHYRFDETLEIARTTTGKNVEVGAVVCLLSFFLRTVEIQKQHARASVTTAVGLSSIHI